MGSPVSLVLSRLEGVRQNGKDRWMARCPAHEDHTPSLSVGEGDDGRVLIHCWAGCATAKIIDTLGLTWNDLYESQR
jgi:putative DNA primase/helicase